MARNTLHKETKKSYIPGSPGVPAHPGSPYRPAYYKWVEREVCGYGVDYNAAIAAGWTRQAVTQVDGSVSFVWVPPPTWRAPYADAGSARLPYTYACRMESYSVYVPAEAYFPPTAAVPPTPAQFITDFLLGWNTRARSIKRVRGAARATFKVPRSTSGAVVGLNTEFNPTGYRDIRFAFYVSNGIAKVVESGEIKHHVGAVTAANTLRIDRAQGRVRYFVDGIEIYSSPNSAEEMHLDAALYTGGDTVDEPTFTGLAAGGGELPALSGFAADYPINGYSLGQLQALTGNASEGVRVAASLLPLIGVGSDRPYAAAAGVLSALTGSGEAETPDVVPSYAIGDGVFSLFSGAANGLTGEIGGSASTLAAFVGLASEGSYGESRGALACLSGYAHALEGPHNAVLNFSALGVDLTAAQSTVLVAFSETINTLTLVGVSRLEDGDVSAAVSAVLNLGVEASLGATLFAVVSTATLQGIPLEQEEVWALNVENMGSTRYENFGFTSFAKIGNAYYGCKPDGIYRLDGETDAGAPVQAMVSFGKQDFGTSALKRITTAYAGVSCEGRLFLKVLAEGEEYVYAARGAGEYLQQQRFDLGKGLRANWLEFELYNASGEDFELASVDFAIVPTTRRI